ncbi:hypothetical protein [Amphibacillus sediminis]|uniref:hypothetical protein n=1 Tax=Amphibacillus sediminis TaxID=360185 RepID=UPI0012EE0E86|nr:hypothetical protein [Amphibacillus sediminis]
MKRAIMSLLLTFFISIGLTIGQADNHAPDSETETVQQDTGHVNLFWDPGHGDSM